jgi:hypothetical protein
VGSADLPDQSDESEPAGRACDGHAGAPRTRDLPDPDERARTYEAMRAHVSAETAEEGSCHPTLLATDGRPSGIPGRVLAGHRKFRSGRP